MNQILSEKEYQRYVIDRLVNSGYEEAPSSEYDRSSAINHYALIRFLDDTQPDTMEAIRKTYKDKAEATIIGSISMAETSKSGSRLDILKHGVNVGHHHLDLMYDKPASKLNNELNELYKKNLFTISEEVWASDTERVDLVIYLNGIAIIAVELKCNAAGQNYGNAISQWRKDRNPKTRLFLWKSGVLVCFAMDLCEVYMTTKLTGEDTFFLPFNQGSGNGINAGAGNSPCEDDYSVHYMWNNILQKDTLLEIIRKFMFIQIKRTEDSKSGKIKERETVIFPRYHQLDVVRKLIADTKINGTSRNYLLQHSAGSGKTNEIAWLSYRLASLHDDNDKAIFNNIIICTDRVVVDRQLQDAILNLEHKAGQVKVLDEKCTSSDLKIALEGNTKIIATTMHKFMYIVDSVKKLSDKNFAVIIDEAHSSTAGKNMIAISQTLGKNEIKEDETVGDIIEREIQSSGKQPNVSIFAFTATPKATTLQLFGTPNTQGQHEAFHVYSMKQAIEEGFILDVLQNYVTYKTFYNINKKIKEDPELKTNDAKRQISRFLQLHEINISQRIEIIVEHFRTTVMKQLGGQAKAMVITSSRAEAVKYRQAFEDYITRKKYKNLHALVAFSGKVSLKEKEYTESGMNGFPETRLTKEFDTDEYQVLIVADKYQTGFDQKKLCAMYILKKLSGVSVVQTLSRLNRICPPYEKSTFILDFTNDYNDIDSAFSTYFTTTILSNTTTASTAYDIYRKLMGYYVIDEDDVEEFTELFYSEDTSGKAKNKIINILKKTSLAIENDKVRTKEEIEEIKQTITSYLRCYSFILQATCLDDSTLHKLFIFLSYLKAFLKRNQSGPGFDLKGKLIAENFSQKIEDVHKTGIKRSAPAVSISNAQRLNLSTDKMAKLSDILDDFNRKTGMNFDTDVTVTALLQIRDLMKKNDELKRYAQNNKIEDFSYKYDEYIDDALIDGLDQNKEFFTMLLNNNEIKKGFMDLFLSDVYNSYQVRVAE